MTCYTMGMEWLDKRLYATKEEQDQWSVEEWRLFWAQLIKTLTEFVDSMTEERVNSCVDEKERRVKAWRLEKKKYAEKDVATWDLDRMTDNVKRLIQATLMQSKRYNYALRNFENLRPLNELHFPTEELDLTCNGHGVHVFEWYDNLKIKV